MGFRVGVDRAADLGGPQLGAEVLELQQHQLGLHGVAKRPGGLPDDDAVPVPLAAAQLAQEAAGLLPPLPGDRPGGVGVVHHPDDLGPSGGDVADAGELPGLGVLRGLLVDGRGPAVGDEAGQAGHAARVSRSASASARIARRRMAAST